MKKTKSDNMYFFWSASILLCMLLACFALIFTSCSKGNPDPVPSDQGTPSDAPETQKPEDTQGQEAGNLTPDTDAPGISNPPDASSTALLTETKDAGQEYVDKFIFLGDSTTNGLAAYDIVNADQVWTPKNGTLTLSRWSIDAIQYDRKNDTVLPIVDAVKQKLPEYMLITLGVNGVSFMEEASFVEEYTNLVNAIKEASPNTKIILNSIYPVSVNYPSSSGITNEKIDKANTWVEQVAIATGAKYLNSSSILKDSTTGAMVESYHNGDFIHPKSETYKLIIDYLRTHAYL